MAVTLEVTNTNYGLQRAVWTGDVGAGNGAGAQFAQFPIKSVQRVSGTGTYTVEGSNDGVTFGALATAIAAINDAVVRPIPENPQFLRVVTAAAAATVVIIGF